MNGNSGIVPTVDLATNNNNGYAYPVYPMMNGFGGSGFGGFGGDGAIWIILIIALLGGFGNNGNGGFFNGGFDNGYAWLSNGQKEIMTNTNNGFDTLHLSNQLEGTRDGIYGLSNQLCNSTSDITSAISNGFYNSEISANNRAVNQMQDIFALSRQFADCCCENRLGIANLNSTILSENCADRAALADGLKDVLINQTANTQKILDTLCQDKIDAKNERIADLERQLTMANLAASQGLQTSQILADNAAQTAALEQYLAPVPRPAYIVQNPNGCNCNSVCGSF